jgi:transcriptional regulator with XRE-family HTH domain
MTSRIPAHEQERLRDFGRRMRELRKEAGFSQEELAHRSHLHRTYISSVERGERNIALLNIYRVAQGLEVSPRILLDDR